MSITINISADSGDDMIEQLGQLCRALLFSNPEPVKSSKRAAPAATQSEVVENTDSSASVQAPALSSAPEAGTDLAPTVVEQEAPQSEGAVKHLEVSDIRPRALARASESDDMNKAVTALIAKYGGRLTSILPEDRAAFLAEVEAL